MKQITVSSEEQAQILHTDSGRGAGGGGGTPLKGLNGDMRPARVRFTGFLS